MSQWETFDSERPDNEREGRDKPERKWLTAGVHYASFRVKQPDGTWKDMPIASVDPDKRVVRIAAGQDTKAELTPIPQPTLSGLSCTWTMTLTDEQANHFERLLMPIPWLTADEQRQIDRRMYLNADGCE